MRLTIISRPPDGSAPGQDGIFQEQVKIRQCILLEYLVQLYNSIIKSEYIPLPFKLPVKLPIPKGGKSFACIFDNYRGINSLLTTFNKILERLALSRINKNNIYAHALLWISNAECYMILEHIQHIFLLRTIARSKLIAF